MQRFLNSAKELGYEPKIHLNGTRVLRGKKSYDATDWMP